MPLLLIVKRRSDEVGAVQTGLARPGSRMRPANRRGELRKMDQTGSQQSGRPCNEYGACVELAPSSVSVRQKSVRALRRLRADPGR